MSFKKLVLVVALLVLYVSMYAEITRNDAEDLVLNQIISEDVGKVNVYIKNNPVSYNIGLNLHKGRHIDTSYNSSWIFFVNDDPAARWYHPCRYIVMDTQTGEYEIIEERIYPANEYQDFELISSPPDPEITSTQITPPINSPTQRTDNSHLYAVIIGGDEVGVGMGWDDDECFWNDTSGIYCTLLNYGYTRNNIIVHYAEGEGPGGNQDLDEPYEDPTDDIDFWADKDTIITTFADLQMILTPQDMLFVYLNNHGYYEGDNAYLMLPGDDVDENRLYDYELAEYTRNINCSQMIVLVNCCYSGGFIDNLNDPNALCQNRVIHTMCGFELGYGEKWITAPSSSLAPKYIEFNLYWTAAAREFYPYINPENTQEVIAWQESYPAGLFPFTEYSTWSNPDPGYPNHDDYPDYHPDEDDGNQDGFVQMNEIFRYANNWDSYSDDRDITYYNGIESMPGYFNPFFDPARNSESPQFFYNSTFVENYLTLKGIAGIVTVANSGSFLEIEGSLLFGGDLIIEEGVTLTMHDCSKITLSSNSNFIVNEGATLVIGNDCQIQGTNIENRVEVYGDILIGDNVAFTAPDDHSWYGVCLYNTEAEVTMDNVTFERCKLYVEARSLTIFNSEFTNSGIEQGGNEVTISGTDFNGCSVCCKWKNYSPYPYQDDEVNISFCTFSNYYDYPVYISGFWNYDLNNNIISQCNGGLKIYECMGIYNCIISNNTIENNTYGNGIFLYHSYADIVGRNSIRGNSRGIVGVRNSSIKIIGNDNYPHSTIQDNEAQELYFDTSSFPEKICYNKIIDDNYINGSVDQYLIHCKNYTGGERKLIIEDNYWGPECEGWIEWTGDHRFSPGEAFDYIPVWIPGPPVNPPKGTGAKGLYADADSLIQIEEYEQAKQVYRDIIELYPESKFAIFSMRNLLPLEIVSGKDFSYLQAYYLTNPNCNYNPERTKLSEFLANYCNIKMENYPDAISFFEDIIADPDTELDSVYAVIDAGYTYLLMGDGGGKSTYIGKMPELKPKSVAEFKKTRDKLLAKVLGLLDQNEEEIVPKTTFYLGQNYPNPFSQSTIINYQLAKGIDEGTIKIYNIRGQLVKILECGESLSTKADGVGYSIVWDGKDKTGKQVSSGIYFYQVEAANFKSKLKKLLLLR